MPGIIKPRKINIDASTICQLKCPSCSTADNSNIAVLGRGFLKLQDFKKLIINNPRVKEIELSNYGEIFLNPEILHIIKFAYLNHVRLTANNGVNLNKVDEEVLEGLVKYKFKSLTCSIDGASNETYIKYRIKGNYENVITNIKIINKYKRKFRSNYPLLIWQFIVFGHNEHEILKAQKLAIDFGMDFQLKLSWDSNFSPVKNKVLPVFGCIMFLLTQNCDYANQRFSV